ncbi:MAG: GntR family transcriptional regulator [Erysipelotrichaceae bacterium]|nr:GntR family transcriptional regulator [Erysipelotrichaceae bacterium]MDD3923686.1 GntR family transcriptional regulator [Erysipelotrichaceae bacterium]MDD4642065.1 GntR family transcriptional regulator [Erysipelotrichaceae bacterium]
MDIIISNRSDKPIYEQIYEQIKNMIIHGTLGNGDLLPSIRNLAKDLKISVITTKRAYEELEHDGFIVTTPGKGCFVAGLNREILKEGLMQDVEEHLISAINISQKINLSKSEMIDLINYLYQEDY